MTALDQTFANLLGGSHTSFKKIERQYSDPERELDRENKSDIQEGMRLLRKIRTGALSTEDENVRQAELRIAHAISERMGETILKLAAQDSPSPITEFRTELRAYDAKYAGQDADSGYALPAQFSVQNLFNAADDMLLRVSERAGSYTEPSHTLDQEELKYVLNEFLRNVNGLSNHQIETVFSGNSKVGAILSGGAVYAAMVKKVVERYAAPELRINTFVIAVDKHKGRAVSERLADADQTANVVLVDDVINKGGTIITALRGVGEYYPNAKIFCEKGVDEPGGWGKRQHEEKMIYLSNLFQDFADLCEEGKRAEAMAIFGQAEAYAKKEGVKLQPGWHIRRAKIEGKS